MSFGNIILKKKRIIVHRFIIFALKITVYGRRSIMRKNGANFALEVAKQAVNYYDAVYFADSTPVPPKIGIHSVFLNRVLTIVVFKCYVFLKI